jgi:hypothetical protein
MEYKENKMKRLLFLIFALVSFSISAQGIKPAVNISPVNVYLDGDYFFFESPLLFGVTYDVGFREIGLYLSPVLVGYGDSNLLGLSIALDVNVFGNFRIGGAYRLYNTEQGFLGVGSNNLLLNLNFKLY